MKRAIHLEHRASSRLGKHEGEPSLGLCDRLDRTRDNSQRQLPTDHDYAVSTREYQTDQSSLKTAPAAARSVFGKQQKQRQKQTYQFGDIDTVTPYQANALIEQGFEPTSDISPVKRRYDQLANTTTSRIAAASKGFPESLSSCCGCRVELGLRVEQTRSHSLSLTFESQTPMLKLELACAVLVGRDHCQLMGAT